MSSSFGRVLKISTFGESHGKAIGMVLDGFPSGIEIDEELIHADLQRRRPGQSKLTTQRKEDESFEILSGIFEGKSTGSPIALTIQNKDYKPGDYDHLKDSYRPGHADLTYQEKFGHRDHRGGGRSSARETANWVMGGAFAKMLLKNTGIKITSFVSQVGNVVLEEKLDEIDLTKIDSNEVRCPDSKSADKMISLIEAIRKEGDSVGGKITCIVKNVPIGLGEPVFDKLQSRLAQAMLSINATKGFQYGSGFLAASMKGTEHNDKLISNNEQITSQTNNAGGILGGISNGQDIIFEVAFKPVSTIMQDQESVDKDGNTVILKGKGRHDPCVVPRAVPIVDALTALVLADFYLLRRTSSI